MSHLNDLNLHLQRAGKFISSLYDHVKAFQRKLELLQKQLEKGDLSHFTACKKLLEEDRNGMRHCCHCVLKNIPTCLRMSSKDFSANFLTSTHICLNLCYFLLLFIAIQKVHLLIRAELIKLQECSDLKSSFRDLPLDKFYSSVPAST